MTTDLKETIVRTKSELKYSARHGYGCTEVGNDDLTALLAAAEAYPDACQHAEEMADAAVKARDAALEEAAKVAEAVDPEKPANWLHPRHKIAFAIRALRSKP